jgi:hypothetical protein
MTTQVVLMNKLGISLASDSAVSAGNRVLNTYEKIFELSAPHKIAILTSSSADFMMHPWEVMLSAWSENLTTTHTSTEAYMEDLLKWLRTSIQSQGELSNFESDLIHSYLYGQNGIRDIARECLIDVFNENFVTQLDSNEKELWSSGTWTQEFRDQMTAKLTPTVIRQCMDGLDALIKDRQEWTALDNVSISQARVWVEWFWQSFETDFVSSSFSDFPDIPGLSEKLNDLSLSAIVHPTDINKTTLALVGYGVKDLFPSATMVDIHGVLGGAVLKRWQFNRSVAAEQQPIHLFFGQTEAIDSLARGRDEMITNVARESQRSLLVDIYEQLPVSDDLQQVRQKIEESMESNTLEESIRSATQKSRLQPFEYAIWMSPMGDLAEFAGRLIGVQSIYAAMNQENPTVGGPIDVAVITLRSGFEWIRHKTRSDIT